MRKRTEKGGSPFGAILVKNQLNNYSKNHSKNDHQTTLNVMPKGSQDGAEIVTITHQKTMPKLVTEKIMKIIKHHVSLKGKIIEIHCKNKCFWWFRKLRTRTVKVSNKLQKSIPTSMKNQYKFHARKRDTQNMEIHQQSDPKRTETTRKKQMQHK